MNSKEPSVVEWTDMPLSVSDQYWQLKALFLDQQVRDPSVSERVTLVPPRKNDIGLWDLAYVQPRGVGMNSNKEQEGEDMESELMYKQMASPMTVGEQRQPLQRVLNEHGEQLDKLSELVSILETRLQPVRNSMPRNEQSDTDRALKSGSPTLNQIVAQTESVGNLGRRISNLLEELEV